MSDVELANLLDIVNLRYLLEREKSLESINDWNDILSGGER